MKKISIALGAAALGLSAVSASAATLDEVKAKGFIQCGVSQGLPGFSNQNDQGDWTGIDADFCRAVAAAVFGDASAVKFTPLSAKERFASLTSNSIDILSRNTTWTMSRDTKHGDFVGVNYYDGQGMMVRKELGVKSALELDGAAVCTNLGTTTELNLNDYFTSNNMKFDPVVFEKADDVVAAYDSGRCDVYTTDRSGLAAQRLKLTNPDDHMVLPETISKEPLGPLVRQGDDQWFDIVKWTLYAMIASEELGVSSENVDEMAKSENPEIKRLLGVDGSFGADLGIPNDWAMQAIKQVGNYGEVYERHVGANTPLQLTREGTPNALWTDGGLMYAPPIR